MVYLGILHKVGRMVPRYKRRAVHPMKQESSRASACGEVEKKIVNASLNV